MEAVLGRAARTLSAVVLAAAVAGCTTFSQVKESEPFYEGDFAGNYQSVSACVALAWNELSGGRYQHVVDPEDQVAFIIGTPGAFTAVHVSHTTVRQISDATVRVEYRKPPRLFGTPAWVWDSVKDCVARRA